jgi:adenylosuccinate lyase
MLTAISPVDGRYHSKTKVLSDYFSEYALIRYRVDVEIQYFMALCNIPLTQLKDIKQETLSEMEHIVLNFNMEDAKSIKNIESKTNHDVKAVEYFIKEQMVRLNAGKYKEFVHFGLTSQDINNTAFPMMIRDALHNVLIPELILVINQIQDMAALFKGIPMLARTHGQPASPTTLGKEFSVFHERLSDEIETLKNIRLKAKFGGATGNFNAHKLSYPGIDWLSFGDMFVNKLGLHRSRYTTQIAHYDDLSALFHSLSRINIILTDFCRDIWTYISMDYFKQRVVEGEVGSSAMPHKVNPIDFENAEGNIGIANALFYHLAEKLPVSRLQRDLTDSTVLRNVGVPFAHTVLAYTAIQKGLSKLTLNEIKLHADLESNWAVVAEAIQNILRREGYPEPYEALKDLTRGKSEITRLDIVSFIDKLALSEALKSELKAITPHNYIGYYE